MSGIDPKQIARFVIILAVIALLINSCQDFGTHQRLASAPVSTPFVQTVVQPPQQQPDTGAAAARQAAQDAAAEHAKFLARYLNPGFVRRPGMKTVAIAVVSENGKFNRAVSAAVVSRFKTNSVEIFPSLFTPEFVSDGLFNSAFTDANEIFKKLELAHSLDALLLARQTVRYSTNPPSLDNVITANMELEIAAFPADAYAESRTWTFRANGAGFTRDDARAMAEERLIKQIAADNKMSLAPTFTSNLNQ